MKMEAILKNLQHLREQELHSNIAKICNLALTLGEQKPGSFSIQAKNQILLYYADALYQMHQYLQAEHFYRQALEMRKNSLKKSKNHKINDNQSDIPSDVDIKYKIHLCLIALKQNSAAKEILQTIPARMLTPKINMALGCLYRDCGMERSALTCFKEVLKECPLALDAIENLLKLGVKGTEVSSLIVDLSSEVSWLNQWVKAQAQMNAREFANAIKSFKSMDTHGLLKDNTYLSVSMAYCYHYMCEDNKAISILQKALRLDPSLVAGRDLLSTLLAESGTKDHIQTLERLVPSMDTSLWQCEHWIVLGNYNLATKKYDKAAYFGQQALVMDRTNVDAYLLKANALLHLKEYSMVASHCTEALQLCSYRYDIHKCLVECYIQSSRLREAESVAINACRQLNFSAHGYCLHAAVLLKDPMASSKTLRKTLEKAVSLDKNGLTTALPMLAEYIMSDQQYEQAVELIQKHIDSHRPTSKLHLLLADCFVALRKDEDAFTHYNLALKLDPNNQKATEGLNNIGTSMSVSKIDSYYSSMFDGTSYQTPSSTAKNNLSDHEADPESDTDAWPAVADVSNFD
ncbi:unnamed protein product [Callosobruchus maculatus]|uniref:Anaphase-promoting complex subunit 7 n=2 Tax=Callosobruchus maculatus TaxID=64391 RepID=A0A653CSQ6_CALMS|nr:unnamed protein product [Callosobruchus maculatus]